MSQTEHKNISKIVSISVAVLALILLLLYMQGSFVSKVAPGLSPQSSDSNPPKSQTALVEIKQVGDILTWPGTVRSRTVANIAPRMTARILEIKVNAGDKVKKGDVIARLDEREIRAQENAALAALAGAKPRPIAPRQTNNVPAACTVKKRQPAKNLMPSSRRQKRRKPRSIRQPAR